MIASQVTDDVPIDWAKCAETALTEQRNAWELINEATLKLEGRRAKLPTNKRGFQVDVAFKKLGEAVFNPDNISLRSYKRMKNDDQVSSALEVIINSLVSRGWEINDGDEEQNKFIKWMFSRLPMVKKFEDILSALWAGFSTTEMDFEFMEDGPYKNMWRVENLRTLPPETIDIFVQPNGKVTKIEQVNNASSYISGLSNLAPPTSNRGFATASISPQKGNGSIPIRADKILLFTNKGEFGNPYGVSMLRPAYLSWFTKEFLIKYRNRYLEIMGGGFIIGSVKRGKTTAFRDELLDMKGTSVLVHNDNQNVRIEFPPHGDDPYRRPINYCDSQINKTLLVPDLLMGQNTEFGNRALSETQFASFKLTRIHKLQRDMAELMRQVIEQIIYYNWGEQEEYPKFVFKAWSVLELEQLANMLQKVAKFQLVGTNDLKWMREMLELPDLEEGGIGDPLVEVGGATKVNTPDKQPSQRSGGGGDVDDDIDSTKRESTPVG